MNAWSLRPGGLLAAAAFLAVLAVSYWHSSRVAHLGERISQASGQIVALDVAVTGLSGALLAAILEPDPNEAKRQLADFERDAMHALGVLEQLTEDEVAFVAPDEKEREEQELGRPVALRAAMVQTLHDAQSLVALRGSADPMPNASNALAALQASRHQLSEIVLDAIDDERAEIQAATRRIARTRQVWMWQSVGLSLLGLACLVANRLRLASWYNAQATAVSAQLAALRHGAARAQLHAQVADPALQGALIGLDESLQDERAAAQVRERDMQSELEHRSNALQMSNARLKQVNETRRRFLADLGHSLKTPLSIARGTVENVGRAGVEGDVAKALQALDNVDQRVSDLLSLSRADDGRLVSRNSLIELTDLLDHRIAELRVLPNGEH
ncbi:HAMP domain-containing histidine kinase [Actibacterium ureilyticum]|uniref:HAMP domain-containing histidine kinase n=1 Tax=Actibacterium ureilyticum TaxID=1590614 RepID=UPI001595BC68|nr:HAMP domain-containing histidine kinase [Actibacterium ureilyticum]